MKFTGGQLGWRLEHITSIFFNKAMENHCCLSFSTYQRTGINVCESRPIAQPCSFPPSLPIQLSTACKTAGQGLGPNATSLLPVK